MRHLSTRKPPKSRVERPALRWGQRFLAALLLIGAPLGLVAPGLAMTMPVHAHSATRLATDPPGNLDEQVTDAAGVLAGEVPALEQSLEQLRTEHGLQLFVVFVDSFDGITGEEWARATFQASGMGGDDVLLAVAVRDRRFSTWTTSESRLTAEQDRIVRSEFIEPALSSDDWAGAVEGAVDGYSRAAEGLLGNAGTGTGTSRDGGGGGFPLWLLVPVGGVALLVARRRRGRHAPQGDSPDWRPATSDEAPDVPTEQLRRETAAALVDLDDAVRSSAEELAFAEAQFGVQATRGFKQALDEARQHAAEAFRLQRALSEEDRSGGLDESTLRSRLRAILALAADADRTLDAQEAEFTRLRGLEATVPQFLDELRGRLEEVRRQVPVAEQELAGLSVQHSDTALATVRGNVDHAQRLLGSVEGFLTTGHEHVASGNRAAAVAAARAAEEAIGQADALLSAVARAREELALASDRIDAALASLSSDVADAERLGADDQLTTTTLEQARSAITAGRDARDGGDSLAALRRLTRAEHDLDNALARYREEDDRVGRSRQLLDQRLDPVRTRLESIDATIQSRRGAIGPEARTHMAEAVRLYNAAVDLVTEDPARAAELLDAAEDHGELALSAAQEDIDLFSGYGGGASGYGGVNGGSLILGGILGGVLSGGLGGSRGGGWGGSSGGFGGGFGGGGGFSGGGFGGGGRF